MLPPQTRVLWMAIFVSTILVFAMGSMVQPHDLTPPLTTLIALGAAAIAVPITGAVFVRQTYRQQLRALKLAVRDVPAPVEPKEYRGVSLSQKVIDDPTAARRIFRIYQTSTIIGLAMSEVPALLGLVARTQGADMRVGLAFSVISWIAIAARFPTRGRALAPLKDVYGATIIDP